MWKWILIILGVLVLLIALVVIIGLLLPKTHSASRRARYEQPASVVWEAISNYEQHPTWRSNVKRMERLDDRDGRAVWREVRGRGDFMDAMIITFDPPRKLVTQVLDNRDFGGTWTWEITSIDEKTCALTITEDGEIYNPIFRFVARFILGYRYTMDGVHRALAAKFEQEVRFED